MPIEVPVKLPAQEATVKVTVEDVIFQLNEQSVARRWANICLILQQFAWDHDKLSDKQKRYLLGYINEAKQKLESSKD